MAKGMSQSRIASIGYLRLNPQLEFCHPLHFDGNFISSENGTGVNGPFVSES